MTDNNLQALRYPWDYATLQRKRRSLKRDLESGAALFDLKVALLGGATTAELKKTLELFLLSKGFRPRFYESQFNRYLEEVMFGGQELKKFHPDVAIVHPVTPNLQRLPDHLEADLKVTESLKSEMTQWTTIWDRLCQDYGCTVIQSNFSLPLQRPLGHLDSTEEYGGLNFIMKLNLALGQAARDRKGVAINDVHYLSSRLGLANWYSPTLWYSYGIYESAAANTHLAHNVAGLIGAHYGRSKKCLVLDLDNTIWGGVIGDDGVEGIRLNRGDSIGEAFLDFQAYLQKLKRVGVLLAVCSKNEDSSARLGFTHSNCVLAPHDFSAFKANWNPKSENLREIARELNLSLESFVFVDDNPAERELVRQHLPQVAVPELGGDVTSYIEILEGEGYFEFSSISAEDGARHHYYQDNAERTKAACTYASYFDYLKSLAMKTEIAPFCDSLIQRITQLINKTNQFNLTTQRMNLPQVSELMKNRDYLCLYATLEDRFGDSGLVTVVVGRHEREHLYIEHWLMSCRVLKRELEVALFDEIVRLARLRGVKEIRGLYLPTDKNALVQDHYSNLGFEKIDVTPSSFAGRPSTTWRYLVGSDHRNLCTTISKKEANKNNG